MDGFTLRLFFFPLVGASLNSIGRSIIKLDILMHKKLIMQKPVVLIISRTHALIKFVCCPMAYSKYSIVHCHGLGSGVCYQACYIALCQQRSYVGAVTQLCLFNIQVMDA